MSNSTVFQSAIETALAAMCSHPNHELNIGYRHKIYAALGVREPQQGDKFTIGHQRRAHLAIRTVYHVLPIWEHMRPNDSSVRNLLGDCLAVLEGELDLQKAEHRWRSYEVHLSYVQGQVTYEEMFPLAVGQAAVRAFATVRRDERFNPKRIDYNIDETLLDEVDLDAPFYAVRAYANSEPGLPNFDPTKFSTFWNWWLTEAVSSVYMLIPQAPA
jgi:hypothetical protein